MHPKCRMFNKLYNRVKVDVLLEREGIEKGPRLLQKEAQTNRTSQDAPREEKKKVNKLKA